MKILVTGANGYLGRGIVKQLLDDGIEVIATSYSIDGIDKRAHRIAVDLFSVENPFTFFNEPEIVLHLAWRDGFVHYSERHIDDLPKHYLFLKKMADNGVKKIVGMGSMHEIGFYEGSVDGNTKCNPISLYGIAKNALRNCLDVLANNNDQLVWQWLRGFYIVANTDYGSSIFSKIVSSSEKGDNIFPFTKGQNQFDFLDYDMFCQQVAASVEQSRINGIINICSGRPEKLADRVERFIKENNLDIKLEYGAYQDRPYGLKSIFETDFKRHSEPR
ncbi:MAG: NAD(P)-dependent oxidoreductase, partial [Liquorilactobacillus hordei]|uniref:NAD-dependent epimerase/dehydratase family protein n=1 Tax=Liquorilactobacillus hordei TaxID=468911 RepID=UPI0039EC0234